MERYEVVSAKPVSVRVGTEQKSEIKTLKKGKSFRTAPVFIVDLLKQGWVKNAESKREEKQPDAKSTGTADNRGAK